MKSVLIGLKETKYQILIIAILTFGVYFNSLFNQFVWDDHLFVEEWGAIRSFDNVGEVFKGSAPSAQGKIYRPVRGLIYMVDWQMFGMNPVGYRAQAVLLHLSVTVLIYFVVKLISADLKLISADKKGRVGSYVAWLPFIVALIFGVHPIHTETIDYISTSLETFGSLFFFGSFLLYLYANGERMSKRMYANERIIMQIASLGLAMLAFFTYEMTITLPVLIVLYEWTFGNFQFAKFSSGKAIFNFQFWKKRFLVYLPYFVVAVSFVVIRTAILGLVSRTDYLGYSFYLTMVTMVKVFVRYVGLMILPVNQTAIHNLVGEFPASMIPYDKLDPILNQTIFDLPVVLSIVTIALSILVAIKVVRLYPFITFGIIWFWVALLPVSYIIPHGGAMAEKYLYIASFGFILAAVFAAAQISAAAANSSTPGVKGAHAPGVSLAGSADLVKQALVYAGVVVVLFYGVSTISRNRVWRDDISLFSDVIKKSPNNLLAHYTLGIWYTGVRNFEASAAH